MTVAAAFMAAGILLLSTPDVAMCRGGGGHGVGGGHSSAHGEASESHAEASESHAAKYGSTISDPEAFLSDTTYGKPAVVIRNPWAYGHGGYNHPDECDKNHMENCK